MPRPILPRKISYKSDITYFKPAGVQLKNLEEVVLTHEEIEALRLKDVKELEQSKCAEEMGISQPTFFRVIKNARKKLSDAVVNGKAIRIEGGNFNFKMQKFRKGEDIMPRGDGTGPAWQSGQGMGRNQGIAAGPEGKCVCIKCGTEVLHARGTPCTEMKCPKCGAQMTRKE